MNTDELDYTTRLLAEAREELVRADTKASVLFAAFSIVVGAVLAGLISGDWAPADLCSTGTVAFWIGTVLIAGAFVALASTLWPRVHHHDPGRDAVRFFGDVVDFRKGDTARLTEAIKKGAHAPAERVVDQFDMVSRIVMSKFSGIRWAIRLYGLGLAVCCISVIAG